MSRSPRPLRSRHRAAVAASAAALSLVALAACSSDFDDSASPSSSASGGGATLAAPNKEPLTIMIGSSGPAETTTVQDTAKAYTAKTGIKVTVIPAQDLTQQLGQAFSGGNPPDLFYVDPARVGLYAQAGNLYPYGKDVDLTEYDATTLQSYTLNGDVQCVPKESAGVLALSINTAAWDKAGLTDADIPTTWDQLHAVAKKLTTKDQVGLSFGATRDRVGAFMVGAGGWFMNDDNTQVTADSPENTQALTYLQDMLKDGSFAWAADVGAGWGGEAFGMQKAAMTVEGGWLPSVMSSDYPDVKYTTVAMPAGPAGIGTLNFSNCWGVAAKSKNLGGAVDLVKFFESDEQAKAAAKSFGATPARLSLADWTKENFPDQVVYLENLDKSKGPVPVPGFDSVLADFDSKIEGLKTGDPATILQETQTNGEAALTAAQG